MLEKLGILTSDYGLRDANVQKLIHSKDLEFDLIINEQFFQECWLMFGYKFNAPVVTISTYGTSDFFDRAMGQLTPWSHVPHMLLSYTDEMTFCERAYNVLLSAYDWFHRNWVALPLHNEKAREHFGHLIAERGGRRLPTVQELEKNISMIFINSHIAVAPPRPAMPGIKNIGGAHIRAPNPLPADIQKFLDEAEHGVIYFSLGAFMQSKSMPKDKLNIFLELFGKLKQRVIWKFEDDSLKSIPSNILIRKWLPQGDILAHKNIVLFMSHGGLFGNFEGIARGVPMFFTPLYGDQYRNALRAVSTGYGRMKKFQLLTAENLYENINELLTNKSYYNRAKRLSALYNDNVVHPMDELMYWIEYVCRHDGASHLKSKAVNMSWFSYLLLDLVAAALILLFVAFTFIKFIVKSLCVRQRKSKSKSNDNTRKKKN